MKIILTTVILISTFSFTASGLVPRRHKWINLKTDHFTIIAPKNYKGFAEKTAVEAERAFQTLKSITSKFPKNTIIIVDPTKDYSNGQATYFPYATITLQPVAPSASTSIGQYDSWLYELLLHEYTHILSFHNHKNLYKPLRWLLGSTISPGYFLPTWYLEGFAVYTESFLTNGGRLKTARYKSMQELFNQKNKKIHISNINEQDLDFFPYGQNPYFFGGWLNQESLKNIEQAKAIHKKFSGRMPFFIASAYKGTTKKSIFKTWKSFFNKSKSNSKEKNINKDFLGHSPKLIKDKVYFIGQDEYQTDAIKEYDLKTKKVKEIARSTRGIHQFQIVDNDVFFISTNKREYEHRVFEIFKASINKYKQRINKPITFMLRARHFHIENKKIIFSKVNINGDSLALSDLDNINSPHKILYTNKKGSRISYPHFINENEIIFAEKEDDLDEKVFVLNITSKNKKEVFTNQHINFISKADNDFIILSEKNGNRRVTNLSDKKTKSISKHTTTIDSNLENSWFSKLTLKGPLVSKLSKEDFPLNEVKNVEVNTINKVSNKPNNEGQEKLQIREKKYSSFNKLKPHYITPNFILSPYGFSGESLYGLSTGGSDPLKFNNYGINVFTDSITKEVSGNFSYLSKHLITPISFSIGKFYEPINLVDVRTSSYANLLTSLDLSPNSTDFLWLLSGGFLWDETNFNSIKENRGGLNFGITYNSRRRRTRELAPDSGLNFSLSNTYFADAGDSYRDYFSSELSLTKFFKSPLIKSHRLLFGIDAFWSSDLLLQTYAPISRNNPLGAGGFTLRGLPTGAVRALELYAIGHFEYRFPILRFDWGPGLWPIFLKRATGAIVSDFGVVNGAQRVNSNINPSLGTGDLLASAGLELTLETKISYHAPLSFQLGIYNYLDKDFYDQGPEIFIGVNLNGFPFQQGF